MKVKDLIRKLKRMDQEAEVWHLWDGGLRTQIEFVYMGKTGVCVTADYDQVAYDDEARPSTAPTVKQEKYWSTPDDPENPS